MTFMPTLKKSSSDFMISSGSTLKGFESIKEMKISFGRSLIFGIFESAARSFIFNWLRI